MSRKWRNIGVIAVALLLLVYVGNQVYTIVKKGISTEVATYATVSDTLQTKGFAIRMETVITSAASGVRSYAVSDGSRVAKGDPVADIYQNESDATAQAKISRLQDEVDVLQALSSPGDTYVSNHDLVNKGIQSALDDIYKAQKAGDYTLLSSGKKAFLSGLSLKNIITQKESTEDYAQRLGVLQTQLDSLKSSTGGRIDYISADFSGYFISQTDGLENAVPAESSDELLEKVKVLTVSQVENLLSLQTSQDSSPVGKIASDFNWFITAVLTKDQAALLTDITSVSIEVPFATTEKIPAKIIAKNVDKDTGEMAVVFRCNYMSPDIAKIRSETIQINIRTYQGVTVSEKAITFEDVTETVTNADGTQTQVVHEKVRGVYVKDGRIIRFVQVFTDKTINGYAICKTEADLSEEEKAQLYTGNTVQLHDEVIIGETDLYDGKLID